MWLKRLATIFIFLLLLFFYFHQESIVLEQTNDNVRYRIELTDNFTVFYFQCPTLTWSVQGTNRLFLNGRVYPLEGSQRFCPKEAIWQIAGGQLLLERGVLTETPWGVLLIALFFWLLLACFRNPRNWDSLAVFSFLWGMMYIMHLISYAYVRSTFYIGEVHTIFAILAAVLLLCYPKHILPLILLALAQLIEYFVLSPYSSNHTFTIAVINLVLLIAFFMHLLRHRSINRRAYFELFAPILRWVAVILYFWAWFHKLNTSFINPIESCAVHFYELTRVNFPFFPTGDWVSYSIIYFTLIVEIALPLMFIFPKTRLIAMLIGVFFHGFLGLSNFRDFTFLMILLYSSYFSEAALERAQKLRPRFLRITPLWLKQALWALILMVMLIALPGIREEEYALAVGILFNVINVGLAASVIAYLLYFEWVKREENFTVGLLQGQSAFMWIFVVLFFINGAMPFIGLKTDNSFDMYSNLRTEQESNHFIFPAHGQIFDYPNDLVEIIETSDPNMNPRGGLLVFWTLRERFYTRQVEYVVFRRNDVVFRVDANNADEILGSPSPMLLNKLMVFQEVTNQCGV